eukprot:15028014-Heterocapsa_arctica.AAC.1
MDIYRGFLLWTIHSRGRCGDSARVTNEPVLDLDPDGYGYIEASAKFGKHKQPLSLSSLAGTTLQRDLTTRLSAPCSTFSRRRWRGSGPSPPRTL